MVRKRKNVLYNYIVNTYGLSKELILKYVEARIDSVLAKLLPQYFEKNSLQRTILNKITEIKKEGFSGWSNESFEKYVKRCVRDEVAKIVEQKYTVQIVPTIQGRVADKVKSIQENESNLEDYEFKCEGTD